MNRPNTSASVAGMMVANASRTRPQRADARRNRDRVLKAARAAFAAEGSDAPLDEIARRGRRWYGDGIPAFRYQGSLVRGRHLRSDRRVDRRGSRLSRRSGPGRAFSSFVERLARDGALKRDLIEALASDGTQLPVGETPIIRTLTDVLAELLHGAQLAGTVRSDISVDDVVALLTGAAYAICRSPADDERARRLLAIMYDGLRSDRTAEEM